MAVARAMDAAGDGRMSAASTVSVRHRMKGGVPEKRMKTVQGKRSAARGHRGDEESHTR